MAIPEQARKEVADLFSHPETAAALRLVKDSGQAVPDSTFSSASRATPEPRSGTSPSPEMGQQAKDAVSKMAPAQNDLFSSPEVAAHLKLVSVNESSSPMATPGAHSRHVAEKVAQMHKTGHDVDNVQKTMTKDNFGRDYG